MNYLPSVLYHRLKIKVLLAFLPATLFHKINQLDWYGDTLHAWIDQHTGDSRLCMLDVACACGDLCEYLHRFGHDVSGIDKSKPMIRLARVRNPAIDFRVADAYALPFGDETFEIVSAASLINIVSDPGRLVKQMVRVCQPGGWITFLFPISGFSEEDLHECISTLGISGFSRAALIAWHESAPKIAIEGVNELLRNSNLHPSEPKFFLNGMIASISAKKGFSQ